MPSRTAWVFRHVVSETYFFPSCSGYFSAHFTVGRFCCSFHSPLWDMWLQSNKSIDCVRRTHTDTHTHTHSVACHAIQKALRRPNQHILIALCWLLAFNVRIQCPVHQPWSACVCVCIFISSWCSPVTVEIKRCLNALLAGFVCGINLEICRNSEAPFYETINTDA